MINEFTIRPKPTNQNAKIAFLSCISIFAFLIITYRVSELYKGVIGLFAIIFLTVAILFYTKYISAYYTYEVTHTSDDVPMFVVRQRIGKRISTLSAVRLRDISNVVYQTAEEKRAYTTEPGFLKYNHLPTLMPKGTILITVRTRYEKSEIRIEGTVELAEILKEYAGVAKAMLPPDEDDE